MLGVASIVFLEPAGDGQCDVLLVAATAPDCTWVFAAMAWIEHDGDQARDLRLAAVLFRALSLGLFRLVDPRFSFQRRFVRLFQQRHQRIDRFQRIQIQNQTMAVLADRLQ